VAWSTGFNEPNSVDPNLPDGTPDPYYNCVDVYTDYSRMFITDEVAAAIGGGYVGLPTGASAHNGIWCSAGAGLSGMMPSPIGNTLPNLVDIHAYPQVAGGPNDTMVNKPLNSISLIFPISCPFSGFSLRC
jgi:hypothetical protein